MNTDPTFESEPEVHEPHWIVQIAFPILATLFFLSQCSLWFAVRFDHYWVAVPLMLISSHLMHGMLIGFHEATHGLLRKSRILNEIDGLIIGTMSLMSFSLYRAAHQIHHAHLASERDDELWPFIHPQMSRAARVTAAILELTMGFLFTPFLFIRTFFRADSPIRNKKLRRRIWMEFGGAVVIWVGVLMVIGFLDAWKYFLWLHVIPAWIAGNMQSLRKYVEHVGLTGSTVNNSTRSIVAEGWVALFLNFTLLHEPYHGVHHWRPGLSHPKLPEHADALEPKEDGDLPPFRTFRAALYDLLMNLGDPKVGGQWLGVARPTRKERVQQDLSKQAGSL